MCLGCVLSGVAAVVGFVFPCMLQQSCAGNHAAPSAATKLFTFRYHSGFRFVTCKCRGRCHGLFLQGVCVYIVSVIPPSCDLPYKHVGWDKNHMTLADIPTICPSVGNWL